MKILPQFPKKVLDLPYLKGLKTGTLIGFSSAWMIQSILYDHSSFIVALALFMIGIIEYLKETKEKYVFIK